MIKISNSPVYKYELPDGHRFPMIKYELLPEQLLYEGTVSEDNFFSPDQLSREELLLTHTEAYLNKLDHQTLSAKESRKIGFPMRPDLVTRGKHIAKGTYLCAQHAIKNNSVALNIAGGTHHSYADHGEGFCVYNDIAIASNLLLHQGLVKQILIIDLDVHQGNGTAHIFENQDQVFTFSMHGAKNYPGRKEKSDLDIGLDDHTEDKTYLDILYNTLPDLIQSTQADIVFFLSGVDVLATDKLGRLSMSIDGCRQRDQFVFEQCRAANIPVAVSMGGGYSPQIRFIIEAHANTFRIAQHVYDY